MVKRRVAICVMVLLACLLVTGCGVPQEEHDAVVPEEEIVPVDEGELKVHFIDVGQGDAVLIDYGTYEMLIDGGRWGDCAAYIPSYIDGALEVMVATHPDADHIGGLDDVLDAFAVEHIWLNGDTATTQTYANFMTKVNAEGAQMHQAQRGDQISLSTLTFGVLHPALPLGSDKNENSIVLELCFGQVDFLFTGDVESEAEASMVSVGLINDIDILKVSHHGSKHCSTAEFLAAAQPEIAIYSAGANNPYGHPAQQTIVRLHDIGATIYGTDVHGTIIVIADGKTYSIQPTNNVPTVVPAGAGDIVHDLTINVNGQGTTDPAPGLHSYDEGADVAVTASAVSGWQFDHWGGDASGTAASITITMNSDKDITAYFSQLPPKQCTLTINVSGQGTTNPHPGSHTYTEGMQVTITANPASGWNFDHWDGDVAGNLPKVVITMDTNKSITACFKEVAARGSDVQITRIFYDGLVPRVESDEYVEITNLGDEPQDLAGWVLKDVDEGYPSFTFPSNILAPGEGIRVYTNEIHPEWGGFSFGYGKAIWNNKDPDTAALYNAQGQEVSRRSY